MSNKRHIIFIINPISGTVKKSGIRQIIESQLNKDLFDYEIIDTQYSGHASVIAQEAKDKGAHIVVAVGGDGTVNEVARAIIQSDTALGIIPCGSGNGLARHLMLPMETHKAIDIINECNIHDLDYGIINEHPFFCTCGMGFDAFISRKFAESQKRGPVTYLENILKEGLKYQSENYKITCEEGSFDIRAYLVSCANASQYGNNAYIAPQASMSDGWLDVIIMDPLDVRDAPQISIDMFNKTLDKNSKIKTFRTKHIHVKREKPGYIHYDGDPVIAGEDVDIAVVHHGIKIIVNAHADKSKRQPNMVQNAFSEFFNDLSNMRTDITKQGRHIQNINKALLRKLNN